MCTSIQQVHVHRTGTHTYTHTQHNALFRCLIDSFSPRKKAQINPTVQKTTLNKTYPTPSSQASFSLSAVRGGEQKSYSPLATPPSLALLFLSLLFFFSSLRRCPWLCFVPVSLCQVTSLILQAIRVRAGNVYEAGTLSAHADAHHINTHSRSHTHTHTE